MDPLQQEDANRQKASEHLSADAKKYFRLIEFDANEVLVTEIRKHVVGLLIIIFIGLFVGVAVMLGTGALATADLNNFLNTEGVNDFKGPIATVGIILLIITLVGTLIGAFIYRSNVIFVTSEKIAQVQYASLFNRKISQLSIGDVQDVSVQQKGIIAHLFNYGTLVVETAGEQQNYTFTFVPHPYERSKDIVGAHERNLVQYGN
jgi:hypothetical protein